MVVVLFLCSFRTAFAWRGRWYTYTISYRVNNPFRAEQSQSRAEVGHNRYDPIPEALSPAL